MTVPVLVLQTWFDIAIQHTGSVMNAYAIAFANNSSTTDDPTPGENVTIPSDVLVYKKEAQYLADKKSIPATSITSNDLQVINPPQGIGQMAIGLTFIIG